MSVVEVAAEVWLVLVAVLTLGLATVSILHALLYKRGVQATLGWVGLIALVPLVGSALYVLFGINRIARRAQRLRRVNSRLNVIPQDALTRELEILHAKHLVSRLPERWVAWTGFHRLAQAVTDHNLLSGNAIKLLRGGDEAYPAMRRAIEGAKHTIVMCSYIFDYDATGELFVEALAAAHRRGVKVHVLIDSVGSRYSRPTTISALKKRGVPVASFIPPLSVRGFAFMNLRTHRKIMVVDGALGFTGGMNIRHGCVLSANPPHPTHDAHFQIEGPVVFHLQKTVTDDWYFTTGELLRGDAYFAPAREPAGPVLACGISDGPDETFQSLQWILHGALSTATKRVTVITPYFVPEEELNTALQVAAMRGVRVDIILPERSNLPFVDWASAAYWEPLLSSGCRVWLAGGVFDHAKLMVVDGAWSLFGSANWDARSLKLNFEFNMEAYDEQLAAAIFAIAQEKMSTAHEVTLEEVRGWSIPRRLRDRAFSLMSPYL